MIGYIYVTKTSDGGVYIGQHTKSFFDEKYTGSGTLLKGREIISCKMIDTAETIDELNEKEIYWIQKCREKYRGKCLNIANGGRNSLSHVYVHWPSRTGYRDIERVSRITGWSPGTIHKWMNRMDGPPKAYRKRKQKLKPHQLMFLNEWVVMEEYYIYRYKHLVIK